MDAPPTLVPEPDVALEPNGFMVANSGEHIHFLDWGGPDDLASPRILAVHGIGQTAWSWAPVARRLAGPGGARRFVSMDLRGHGLSDAPTEDGAYDLDALAGDVVAVAEGSGSRYRTSDGVLLAGHGFGAIVAVRAATLLDEQCAGLVLVDGGWESLEEATGMEADEFLRGIDEPPEVMRSMSAFLADRRRFHPASWDADQERAARATVVETHAGRVVPATRPHATAASVRAMFTYDPITSLAAVRAPVLALIADDDAAGSRRHALNEASAARAAAGIAPIAALTFGDGGQVGHNLMRYRPRDVAAALIDMSA